MGDISVVLLLTVSLQAALWGAADGHWPACQLLSGICQPRWAPCNGKVWNDYGRCKRNERCCIENTTSRDKCPFVVDRRNPHYYYVRGKPGMRTRCKRGRYFQVKNCKCKRLCKEERRARKWLSNYNARLKQHMNTYTLASWNFETNLTAYNQQKLTEAHSVIVAFVKASGKVAAEKFNWTKYLDRLTKEEMASVANPAVSALSANESKRMSNLQSSMLSTYSTGKVCNKPGDASGECYPLNPDLSNVMATSTDANLLLWAWKGWRDATGAKMPDLYEEYVDILNKAATLNNLTDHGAALISNYQNDGRKVNADYDFEADIERLWLEVRPLYEQLHAYARRRLMTRYPNVAFPKSGHIPAHLLGDMWAQEWKGIASLLEPYPKKTAVDVTGEMKRQKYTEERIFKVAEGFYTSLGLRPMTPDFWKYSIFKQPTDRDIACHPAAWSFMNGKDFRIIQCAQINMHHLLVAHHEMGHIEHFMHFSHLPVHFQKGPNPGFAEAIGDVLSMSVATPKYLNKMGLLPNYKPDTQVDLNFLMSQATAIAFLPFGYLVDKWRWDVFAGKSTRDNYNKKWWEARCGYQGVSPAVGRDSSHFDPGAKMHVPADVPYIRYFVSSILQFEMHKCLCKLAGHRGVLYKCNIYKSKRAGRMLRKIMSLGATMPSPDVLKMFSGSTLMSAKPLMTYFDPLLQWLKRENKGHRVGWDAGCPSGSFV